jgi:hypothetical protein
MLAQQLSRLVPQSLRPAPPAWQLVPVVVSQSPPLHAPEGQDVAVPQSPLAAQTCHVVGLAHCVIPGLHATQTPPRHAGLSPEQAAPPLCSVPVASQTCGCEPLHCLCAGLHSPVHAPETQA